MNDSELAQWYELVSDPTLFAGRLAIYALTHRLASQGLAARLGCPVAMLGRLALEPQPTSPEALAALALRFRLNARKLAEVAETHLPAPAMDD